MVDLRAWDRARAVGAVEEAETLGCSRVGTEHLLLATLADPTVRWAFRTVGVDRPGLQAEAVRIEARRRPPRLELITGDAGEAIIEASTRGGALDGDDPTRDQVARVLRLLAQRFLARTASGDVREILDDLGVTRHRTHVLGIIEHDAHRAGLPRPDAPPTPLQPRPRSRRRSSPLDAGRRPGPGAPVG